METDFADLKIGERGQLKRHRADSVKFTFEQDGETWLRIPISYALKLAAGRLVGLATAHTREDACGGEATAATLLE
jgi:hypothetical protein